MKYLCLGYHEEGTWDALLESDRQSLRDRCIAFGNMLRKTGCLIEAGTVQGVRSTTTLRFEKSRVSVTEGAIAGAKPPLGGVVLLDAKDLNHAIHLMSQLPHMLPGGCMEIHPISEDNTPFCGRDKK